MSEKQPLLNRNVRTILYMMTLSFVCALVLSVIASALKAPKEEAKQLDRSRQMLIAARVLSYKGYFLMQDEEGKRVPAKYEKGKFVLGKEQDIASSAQVLDVYKTFFIPLLVDNQGNVKTFKEAGINKDKYIAEFKDVGYYKLPLMLIYKILPQTYDPAKFSAKNAPAAGWVVPVSGFGLWDAIYGYLALEPDGNTVIGITWYDQKETPGLGANIAEQEWQNQFAGKKIFQPTAQGTDLEKAPLGITVVKGTVKEVLGDVPKAQSSVDGMAGATLTGNGVTQAYKDNLAPYRPFFLRINEQKQQ